MVAKYVRSSTANEQHWSMTKMKTNEKYLISGGVASTQSMDPSIEPLSLYMNATLSGAQELKKAEYILG